MRIIRTGSQLAVVMGMAAGLAAPQLPAVASARVTPTISIKATSSQPVVTGDVWVVIHSRPRTSTATIKGSVSGASRGQVLRLYKRQFPFAKPAVRVGTYIPVTGSSQSYAFANLPTLATRYHVELFASPSSTTPLATSPVATVFAVGNGSLRGGQPCGRPVCHEKFRLTVTVPRSALRTEIAKRWFIYFGLNLSPSRIPPQPRFLRLGAGHPHVSAARRINGHEFAVTITLSFRIGNDAYSYYFIPCTRDTESRDGLNLPGHHGCGTLKVISRKRVYLG